MPQNGRKNDKAHLPIHPTPHAINLSGDKKRVYEFITRQYLACCSKKCSGHLEVYVYKKWGGMLLLD
ncbi:DNA topoisomerase [Puccinia triticina 1-1 BBBD Race 1]|uniref:DNA topoisomerase n=1 Tax=Puccinia triticina (isolate 1-1 / race 1 (BBBD)) TaxID=630390 RepID=A0A180GS69_PUCT1|nr:DNA topoisomerase [Puccinia triticina 1-1 BBBD Race 1]